MNVENIKRVRDVIAGLPRERFDMGHWAADAEDDVPPAELIDSCGTSGCIGGWTVALLAPEQENASAACAGELLGLEYGTAYRLFFEYPHSVSPPKAVAVLDHLIATGEVDWSVAEQATA